jgi:hypothetical protein
VTEPSTRCSDHKHCDKYHCVCHGHTRLASVCMCMCSSGKANVCFQPWGEYPGKSLPFLHISTTYQFKFRENPDIEFYSIQEPGQVTSHSDRLRAYIPSCHDVTWRAMTWSWSLTSI